MAASPDPDQRGSGALRQSNASFSSSDADFADRLEAAARWNDLRAGRVAVRAG
jgi:1,2-beta-oligoglucan phosphorylase